MNKKSVVSLAVLSFLAVAAVAARAQTEKPVARLLEDLGGAPNGYVKMIMDRYYAELANDPNAQGVIVIYGSPSEVARRERLIRDTIAFRNFDGSRMTFVNGGFWVETGTQLWLVPAGAENPPPFEPPGPFDSYGSVPAGEMKARMDNLAVQLAAQPSHVAYLVNYGPARTVLREEQRVRNYLKIRKLDLTRFKFVRGGAAAERRTDVYLVEKGAKNKN